MNYFILILTLICSSFGFSQTEMQQPKIEYVSPWSLEELNQLSVGTKIVFEQNCNPKVEKNIVNGTILFSHVKFNKERLAVGLEFNDTIVSTIHYYFSAKQEGLLKEIGLPDFVGTEFVKSKEWTYCNEIDKIIYVVKRSKKRIVVTKKRMC